MPTARDRRAKLAEQHLLNGIDFVEVTNAAQTQLRVHFLNKSPAAGALQPSVISASITGGETIPSVPVNTMHWSTSAAGYPVLELVTGHSGDFSMYTLTLRTNSLTLDRFFDHVAFSFKANCPSTLDCEPAPIECPPILDNTPPIDYLAKDFDSFRKALSEFSALRYPAWQERSEADFAVMFMEALSSLADDLSYQQDRIAAEAWLDTATQRRSLVRLARLVDYEPKVATTARTWLQFEMAGSTVSAIPAGLAVGALSPDGTYIDYETGTGLRDTAEYATHPAWNQMRPHWFDDTQQCLGPGATEMWIARPTEPLQPGQRLAIETTSDPPGDPPVHELVLLTHVDNGEIDDLYNIPLAHLVWRAEDALQHEHDLTRTVVAGNLVPATHGRRFVDTFLVSDEWSAAPGPPRAVVRSGANGTLQFLHTLRNEPLAWLAQDDPLEKPRPEMRVLETRAGETHAWEWRPTLLDAGEFERAFAIDPVRYRLIDPATGFLDYDGDTGATLRFGDGLLGAIPRQGSTFEVTYRSGGGTRGNVAAGAITRLDYTQPITAGIISVTNPFAASSGRDQEPNHQVREMAPQRFRFEQLRAVRPEDYERAATTLPWVQRAGTQFRYTGSWLSIFTAVDPVGSVSVADDQSVELTNLLDRYRMAGYESFVVAPRYASLDIAVTVCAQPDAFRGEVKEAVLAALASSTGADGPHGFFHPDRFTFGVALERSALEAALQNVPGVDGTLELSYRRRGHTPGFIRMPDSVQVARDEIVRVENDPNRPERGSLRVDVRGGK